MLQIPIDYPPQFSTEYFATWERCKLMYKDHIVVLAEKGFCFTLSGDAVRLHQLTNFPVDFRGEHAICHFPAVDLGKVFEAAHSAGCFVAFCEPPEDPGLHLFN